MPRFKKVAPTLLWRKLGLRTLQQAMVERPRFNTELTWGNWGIQALIPGSLKQDTVDRIDILLRTMMRRTDSNADTQFYTNFWFPVTKKSQGQGMGKGIGKYSHVLAPVRSGEIFCQIKCDYPMAVVHAYKMVKHKLPMRTRLVKQEYKGEIIKRFAPRNRELIEKYHVIYKVKSKDALKSQQTSQRLKDGRKYNGSHKLS